MKSFLAATLLVLILFSIIQNWLLAAALCVVVYSFRFGAVMLIPVAILIDGYFGNYEGVPYLSICSIMWYVLVEFVRPKLVDLTKTRDL